MTDSNGKTGTFTGRLSFPTLTAKAAYELSLKGSYPAASADVASPSFQLLLSQTQFDKFLVQAQEFLAQCEANEAAGSKKDALTTKEVADLVKDITGDLSDQRFNTPLKAPSDKTLELAPDTVATLKVIGPKGGDIKVKAIARTESEIAGTSSHIFTKPVILDIEETVHELYPGCVAKVTVNLYSYRNGKNPGFSAGGSIVVFSADDDRFGGGAAINEDDMFLDD
jgi:hypothetical protein